MAYGGTKHVRSRRREVLRQPHVEYADAEALEEPHRHPGGEHAGQHQIGAERDHLFGETVGDIQPARTIGHVGLRGIGGEVRDRGDLVPVGEPQQQLVGAEMDRDDAARPRIGRAGDEERR